MIKLPVVKEEQQKCDKTLASFQTETLFLGATEQSSNDLGLWNQGEVDRNPGFILTCVT